MDDNADDGRAAALATKLDAMKPCELGRTFADKALDKAWEVNPRVEFAFWYWAKAMGKNALRDQRFLKFAAQAMDAYSDLDAGKSSRALAKEIAGLRDHDEWSAIAVFAYARAREYAQKRHPWIAACGTSQWLCCAAVALAEGRGKSGAEAYCAEQARQAEIFRMLFENPLADAGSADHEQPSPPDPSIPARSTR